MEKQAAKGLTSLTVWKKAIDFAVWVVQEIANHLPPDERFSLASQLRHSVQSIPANIAEGYGRFYYQEGVRFCYTARGSLEETRSHILLAYRLQYINGEQYAKAEQSLIELSRLLNGFIAYLKDKKPGANEPGAGFHEPVPGYEIQPDLAVEGLRRMTQPTLTGRKSPPPAPRQLSARASFPALIASSTPRLIDFS